MPLLDAESLRELTPSQADALPPLLRALWHDAQGDWEASHQTAQEVETTEGAAVHAYLHRKEGDLLNARYWYRRAGQSPASGSFETEWQQLATSLLAKLTESSDAAELFGS